MMYENAAINTCPPQMGNKAAMIALTFLAMAGVMIERSMQPAAGQSKPSAATAADTSSVNDAAGEKATFRSRVRDEMADWKLKMHTFNERTEARGKHQTSAAEAALRRAWDKTAVTARNVQAASARDWERVKKSYETALNEMKNAWDRAQS